MVAVVSWPATRKAASSSATSASVRVSPVSASWAPIKARTSGASTVDPWQRRTMSSAADRISSRPHTHDGVREREVDVAGAVVRVRGR